MFIDLTEAQKELQLELRSYFAELMKDVHLPAGTHGVGQAERPIVQQLGRDGWLGIGWPTEYGGRGLGALEQMIFIDEADSAGVPIPMITLGTVGPTIAKYGTPEQKAKFLPEILAGNIEVAIGYTEPQGGTDFASMRTRAVREGDEYVVNGQKVFTTNALNADYVWLACQTDPEAPKHKAISLLLVDTKDPGFSWTPIHLLDGGLTTATFYQDVRVPVSMRVGDENQGWQMFISQINRERVGLGPSAGIFRIIRETTQWLNSTHAPDGRTLSEVEWIRHAMGRLEAKAEVARLFNWRVASLQDQGDINQADASAMKVYVTELSQEVYRTLLDIAGAAGALPAGSPGAVLHGALEQGYRGSIVNTFGGGTNEVQREIVAMAGLGTPRVTR